MQLLLYSFLLLAATTLLLVQSKSVRSTLPSTSSLTTTSDRFKIVSSNQKQLHLNQSPQHHHHSDGHKMSMTTLIINILADLCPHGMLPLAYGLAQGGPTGLLTALGLMAIFGAAAAYSMTNLAYLAKETDTDRLAAASSMIISKLIYFIPCVLFCFF